MDITHARIKFKQDNVIDFIPITDIKEFRKETPKNKSDFRDDKYYSVFYKDEKNPSGIYLPAQICTLCHESEIESIEAKRAVFPHLGSEALDEFSDDSSSVNSDDKNLKTKKPKQKVKKSKAINSDHDSSSDEKNDIELMKRSGGMCIRKRKSALQTVLNEHDKKKKMQEILDSRCNLLSKVTYETDDASSKLCIIQNDFNALSKRYDDLQLQHAKEVMELNKTIIEQKQIILDVKLQMVEMREKYNSLKSSYVKLIEISNTTSKPITPKCSTPLKRNEAKKRLFEDSSPTTNDKKRKNSPIISSAEPIHSIENAIDDMFEIPINDACMPDGNSTSKETDEIKQTADENKNNTASTVNKLIMKPINLPHSVHNLTESTKNVAITKERCSDVQKAENSEMTKEKVTKEGQESEKIDKNKKEKKSKKNKSFKKNESIKDKISTKEKKKTVGKKVKKENSDDEYASDAFDVTSEYENNKTWSKELEDGKKVYFRHLRLGVSIPYEAWKEIKKENKPTLYLRKLAKAIWGTHALMNRAVQLEKTKQRLQNRSPRKPLTPVKMAALRKTFFDFLTNTISVKKDRKVHQTKWKQYLGIYINYLIESEIKDSKEETSSSSSNSSPSSSEDERQNDNSDGIISAMIIANQ